MPELDKYCSISQIGNEIKRIRSVKLHRSLALDMVWFSHVQDSQPSTLVTFDIKKRSAIVRIVQEHRLTGLPRQFGQIRWRHKDDVVRKSGVGGWSRNDSTRHNRNRQAANTLRRQSVRIVTHGTLAPESHSGKSKRPPDSQKVRVLLIPSLSKLLCSYRKTADPSYLFPPCAS